jgi:hypothetical protein
MIKRVLGIGIVVLVGLLAAGGVAVRALPPDASEPAMQRRGAIAPSVAGLDTAGRATVADNGPLAELSDSEIEALHIALEDEYKAWTVYDQVIAGFGQVRPFTNIRRAEENHIAALVALFQRHGLDVPVNDWPGKVPTFETLGQACEAGVQAEIENAGLYDQLFSMVDKPDVIQVFTALQQASQTKHLPAFERCAPGPASGGPSAFVPMVNR